MHTHEQKRKRPHTMVQRTENTSLQRLRSLFKLYGKGRNLVALSEPRTSGTVVPLCDFHKSNTYIAENKGIRPP